MTTLSPDRTPRLIAGFTPPAAATSHAHRTYSDAQLLSQLIACSDRLGTTPTIEQFQSDPSVKAHAHTLVARFGSWNQALRAAGLTVHRLATDQELLAALRDLASHLGRTPSVADVEAARPRTASRSTYSLRFGGVNEALRRAGLDVPRTVDEHLDHAIRAGAQVARRTGRVPSMREWSELREKDASLPSAWRVYRLCQGAGVPPWQAFSALVEQRLSQRTG